MPVRFVYPPELPVSKYRDEIRATLKTHNVIIVCGDTGSGKTTQLPKMLLEAAAQEEYYVACTQPRRLAAVTVAERVAHEMMVPLGSYVGYRHRFAQKTSSDTRLTFMTDGVLLAETRHDPLLKAYNAIVVDEAHERSLNVDFLLGILKRILTRRHDLKVIVSSATLDVTRFSTFFANAPIITVPGRLYPVEVRYRPPIAESELDLPNDVAAAVSELPTDADTLVFLPGERDIRETAERLAHTQAQDDILPLLASLPATEQQRAFHPSARRRIILATNVAETSVTIPGIRCVIDSGLARLSRYVHRTQVQRLQIEPISQASARQRTGRCGRLGPGICIRLYSEEDFNAREAYTPPEVLRSSLAGVILTMLDLRMGAIDSFPFLEPPRGAMIREGYRELLELGALTRKDAEIILTPIGRRLARLPVEPRLARILLAASDWATLPSVLPIVAALSCDDPKRRSSDERAKAAQAHAAFRVPGSDFLGILKLWTWWEKETHTLSQSKARTLAKKTYLSYPKMREWRDLVSQLTRMCQRLGLDCEHDNGGPDAFHRALLTGLLSRLGKLDVEEHDYRGAYGLRFAIHPGSVLAKKSPPWLMAGELVDTSRLFARTVAAIDPAWIESTAGTLCKRHCHSPEYDPLSGFVRATEQVTLYGLVIVPARRCDFSRYNPALARTIFIRAALVEGAFPRPPPEVRANLALLDALRRLADKMRQRELFPTERLEAYFAAILPPDVYSADAVRKWLRSGKRPAFLLKKNDWWPNTSAPSRDFPDNVRLGNVQATLTYRHTPDDPETDGITCTVFRSHALALRLWPADYLVPGALPEKLMWMLSVLPSAQRRVLTPLADTVAGLMAHLKPGSEPLTDAVCRIIYEQWGFRINPTTWDTIRMPSCFRVRFRIRDDTNGETLAVSRSLDEVLQKAGVTANVHTPIRSTAQRPVTSWVFGTISESTSTNTAGWNCTRYPALCDESTGVTLRLYPTAEAAARIHAAGLTRLFLLQLDVHARLPVRRRDLSEGAALYLKQMNYTSDHLAEDILAGAIRAAWIEGKPPIRDADTFTQRLTEGRNALVETQFNLQKLVIRLLEEAFDIRTRLETDERLPSETQEAVQTQLAFLVCRGFPRYVPLARIQHFTRYLKGIRVRLDRARHSPSSDHDKEERFAPYWQRYEDAITGASGVKTHVQALQEYRWLVEEYRISVFAQELHTAESVSPKRLDAKWREALVNPPYGE